MRTTMSALAALLVCLAGQGMVRADGPPLVRDDGDGGISTLKFTGDVQTIEARWGRGYRWGYYGYGYPYYYGGYYGYPYAYTAPYYTYAAPYYGGAYYYGYPYRRGFYRGYYRIDMTDPAPPAANLGTVPLASSTKINAPKPNLPGGLQLTEFVPNSRTGDTVSVVRKGTKTVVPSERGNPYGGNAVVPVPNGSGSQPNFIIPPPNGDPNRPMVPRDGLPVSLPRETTGEVFPVVYHDGPAPAPAARTTAAPAPSTLRLQYSAYGEVR